MRIGTIILLSCCIALLACNSDQEVTTDMIHFPSSAGDATDDRPLPVITFNEATFDFGKIAQGEVVRHQFTLKNIGKAPLIISTVEPSCGCTVMRDWPKDPIAPGKSATIEVEFDSSRQNPGFQKKSITVLANTVPARNVLHLEGEILGPQTP